MSSISDEVWFTDINGEITLANPEGLKEFNLRVLNDTTVEAMAINLEVYRDDGSPRPVAESPPLRALTGEVIRAEEEIVRTPRNGELRYRRISAAPVRDATGQIIGSVSVVRDITEHKRAELALLENFRLLNQAQEIAHVGSWELDLLTNQLKWSDEAYRIFGSQPGEFALTTELYLDWLHPEDRAKVEAAFFDSVREGHDTYESEHRLVRKHTGEVRMVHERCRHFRDAAGNVVRSCGMVQDITESKQAEEQIKAALAEKDVMLKEIHHRVKNNLQVISSLISLQSDAVVDEPIRAVLGDVRDRVRTMALVHEKLYLTDNLARLNFADYTASLLQHLWRSHGVLAEKVRLELAVASVELPIEAAVPCGLILNELVGNALKHAFPNARNGKVRVVLALDPADEVVSLRVCDNGSGLPAGLDWQQANSLGLRLVQMLVSQLRGTVTMGMGPGTEFLVNFSLKRFHS
ncbi:MAG: histidine kinase dimerization/phosphoacceptor domain -containing protein [Verrucomicrobiota bacterium]